MGRWKITEENEKMAAKTRHPWLHENEKMFEEDVENQQGFSS